MVQRCLPLLKGDPDHVVTERGRGQVREWLTWVADAADIEFSGIGQVACIRRNVYTTSGAWIGKEHAWIITSGVVDTISAADIHTHVREHWGIENKVHYPRDTTWREDAQRAYAGNGPQTMASLRNFAVGSFGYTTSTRSNRSPNGSPETGTGLSTYSLSNVTPTTYSDLDLALGFGPDRG